MKASALVCVLAMTLSSAAFAQKVSVEYAHGVDFSKYKTYAWGHNKGELPDKLEDQHIKDQLNAVLQSKGLTLASSAKPDLIVAYQATVEQGPKQVDTYYDSSFGWGWGPGWGWGWGPGWGFGWGDMGPGYAVSTMREIQTGDLLVDMMNPATKTVVFRGYASGAFHNDPIKEDKLMSKAIDKMFKHFPPKEKK